MSLTKEKVEKVLDEIRPFLQRDGGDISLVSIETNTLRVKFNGFCSVCSKSSMTLMSIAAIIKEKLPEVKQVIE